MKITVEFDSYEEFLSFRAPPAHVPYVPSPTGLATVVSLADLAAAAQPASEEKPKRTRRTKAEIAAAEAPVQAAKLPESPPADPFGDEPVPTDDFDDAPAPAAPATKDEVRAALVGYQDRLVASGKGLETARETVMALLKKVGDADKLGALTEGKFRAVINAANNAK